MNLENKIILNSCPGCKTKEQLLVFIENNVGWCRNCGTVLRKSDDNIEIYCHVPRNAPFQQDIIVDEKTKQLLKF